MTFNDFCLWLDQMGFEAEQPFKGINGKRRWRFDFALPGGPVAVEYMGMGRGKGWESERGGHETRKGLANDYAKITEAQLCGVTLILCTAETIQDGRCQEWVEHALQDQDL